MQDLARRYRVLTLVMLGAISIAEASRRLSLSYRQTWTLYSRFRSAGGSVDSLRFQREHPAPNKTPDGVRYRVTRGLGYRGWAGIELGVRVIPSRSVAAFYQGELIEEFPLESPRPADLSSFRRAVGES